jgi:hypothetical protein
LHWVHSEVCDNANALACSRPKKPSPSFPIYVYVHAVTSNAGTN